VLHSLLECFDTRRERGDRLANQRELRFHFAAQVVDRYFQIADAPFELLEPSLDFDEPPIDLVEPSIDLVEPSIDLVEPVVDAREFTRHHAGELIEEVASVLIHAPR
jgi:hypothetical protein